MEELCGRYFSVIIKNFRCHMSLEVEFDLGFTHLRGMNGKGKTTVFEAIKWCIYGGRGGIAPWPSLLGNRKRPTTSVEIATDSYRIYRRNSPSQLTYEDETGQYSDADAQYYINLLFGSHPLWMVSQRQDNILMTAPDNVRHEAIMNLIFPGDCAKDTITTVKTRYKMYQEDLTKWTDELDRVRTAIASTKKKYGLTRDDFLKVKELDKLRDDEEQLRSELDSILENNGRITQFHEHKNSVKRRLADMELVDGSEIERLSNEVDRSPPIKEEIAKWEKKLAEDESEHQAKISQLNIDKMTEVNAIKLEIANLRVELQRCQDYERAKTELDSLLADKRRIQAQISQLEDKSKTIRSKMNDIQPQYSHLTDSQFADLVSENMANERLRTNHYSKAMKLRIPYTKDAIRSEMEKLRGMMSREISQIRRQHAQLSNSMEAKIRTAQELPRVRQQHADLVKELDKTRIQLEQTKTSISEINLDELYKSKDELSTRLHHAALAESYKRLKCPHCQKDCGLHNGNLVAEVPESKETSSELSILMNTLNSTIQKSQNNLKSMNKRVTTLTGSEARLQSEIQQLEVKIRELELASNMEVDGELVTSLSRKIKDHEHANDRYRDVKQLEVIELLNLTDDKEERRLKAELVKIQDQINRLNLNSLNDRIESSEKNLARLVSNKSVSSVEKEMANLNKKLKQCEATYSSKVERLNSLHLALVDKHESKLATLRRSLNEAVRKNELRLKRIKELEDKLSTYQMLSNQLKDLEQSPLNDEIPIDTASKKSELEDLRDIIYRVEQAADLIPKRQRIKRINARIDNLNKLIVEGGEMITHLEKFKYVRIESYFRQLSEYCNRFTEVLLKDENLVMVIGIDKKLKSGKSKDAVHINLIKDGDNIDYTSLNVGHKQVLSLILTLSIALSRLESVQVILLDEILNSLSFEFRDRCMNLFNEANLNPLYELMEPLLTRKRIVLVDHTIKHCPNIIKLK